MDERLALLLEIQELEFVLINLNLFLDTHPQDRAALRDYAAARDKYLPVVKPHNSSACYPAQSFFKSQKTTIILFLYYFKLSFLCHFYQFLSIE
jgi:hypothetical protein